MFLVDNVKKSVAWYKELLGAKNDHDLDEFDQILNENGDVLLMLHKGNAEEHGVTKPDGEKPGGGTLVWVYVSDISGIIEKANELAAPIIAGPHKNPNTGWTEVTISDPDGYLLAFAEISTD